MRTLVFLILLVGIAAVSGQQRDIGTGGSSVGIKPTAPREPIIVQITAISPERDWTNLKGKVINARLLSFTNPAPGETGPITVVVDGKVRLLLTATRKTTDYPIDQLSEADREFIATVEKGVAAAAKAATSEVE